MLLFQVTAPWILILQSALGGSPDYVLPDATTSVGRVVVVKSDVGRTGIIVRAPSHQLIDGSETFLIPTGQAATFQPRNSEWKVLSAYIPATAAGAHNLLSATHSDTIVSGPTDNAVPLGSGLAWVATTIPDCTDTAGKHLNYNDGFNTFSCGTSSSGGGTITETEIDFDTCGVEFAAAKHAETCSIVVVDASVGAASKITLSQSGAAATGRDADENDMDHLACTAEPAAGSFTLICRALEGPTHGKFKINYMVG